MPDYKQLMRRKIPTRKIGQETARPGKFLTKIIFSLIFAVLIFAAILGGRHLLLHFPNFKIESVSIVDPKGQPVSNPEDFFHLDLDSESNLFSLDMERVLQDIRARHPQLLDVFIRKQFPNRLLIKVLERKPVAIIVSLRDFYLVDGEAFILPFKSVYKDLPKIVGIAPSQMRLYAKNHSLRLRKALDLLKELKKVKIYPEYKLSKIDVRRYSDIVFYLENGVEVKMGQSGFEKKVTRLNEVLAQLKASDTVPKYIDMRFDDPYVKPR